MAKKTRHPHFNKLPKFCTADATGSCLIYEVVNQIDGMGVIEARLKCVQNLRYDGVDVLSEEPTGEDMFLQVRTGSFLPETYNDMDLTWYEHDDDPSKELTLDDIIVMCSI